MARFLELVRSAGRRPGGRVGDRRRAARSFRPTDLPGAARLESRDLPSGGLPPGATIVQRPDATIILPPDIEPGKTYPLVVAFSYDGIPDGDQYTPLKVWKTLGPEMGWIVYASKEDANADFYTKDPKVIPKTAATIKAHVDAAAADLPVDTSRIILTGMSGGGNFAEYFNLAYPGFAAAVIDNSGASPLRAVPGAPAARPGAEPPARRARSFGDSRRVAILMASPSDSTFYPLAIHRDRPYYQAVGWQTLFVSFPGGHHFAPLSDYRQSIAWLESRPSWQ